MKIVAVLENLAKTPVTYHYGRFVLNSSFINALVKYTSFDEIHFFVDDYSESQKVLALLKKKLNCNKIRIFPIYIFAEQLQERSYHAIHTNMFMLLSGIAIIRNKIDPRVPITATTATIAYPFYDNEFSLLLSLLNDKDAIIVPSVNSYKYVDNICEQITKNSNNNSLKRSFNLECIPYGIEIPAKSLPPRKSKGKVTILIFSRLSKYDKNDLLPILSLLKQIIKLTGNNTRFIIAGDCSDSSYLKTLTNELEFLKINKFVKIITTPSEKRKISLFKSADIFLALSDNIQESFGIVLLEAMSHGLPIVAADWDGFRDLVKEGENGMRIDTFKLKNAENYFFDQRRLSIFPFSHALAYWKYDTYLNSQVTFIDRQSFVDKVVGLIKNDKLREKMSAESQRNVQEYAWGKIIKRYDNLWSDLYNKKVNESDTPQKQLLINESILDSFYTQIYEDVVVGLIEGKTDTVSLKRLVLNYSDLKFLLDEKILSMILSELKISTQSVSVLVSKIENIPGKVLFNLSWLLKNGFIRIIK